MMSTLRRILYIIFVLFVLLLLWEFLYRRGLISPIRFSHPLGVIETLGTSDFQRGFYRVMLTQMVVALLLGGGLGFTIAGVINMSQSLSRVVVGLLRLGRWLPFIVFWPLPIWPPRQNYEYEPVIWAFIINIIAVGLSTCYTTLISRNTPALTSSQKRSWVVDDALIQATLIATFSQVWVGEYGWLFISLQPGNIGMGYAALFVILLFLAILRLLLRADLEESVLVQSMVLANTSAGNFALKWASFFLAALSIGVWHILSIGSFASVISSPFEVLKSSYNILVAGKPATAVGTTLWPHLAVSAGELAIGLCFGGAIAICAFSVMRRFSSFRPSLFSTLYFLHPISLLFSLLFIHWFGLIGSSQAVVQTTLLTIFPFALTLWALRERTGASRVLLAGEQAMAFAIIGVLFGGLWGSQSGVGFFMSVSRVYGHVSEGLVASLFMAIFLIMISWILRKIGHRM